MTDKTKTAVILSLLAVSLVVSQVINFWPLEDASARLDAMPVKGLFFRMSEIALTDAETNRLEGARGYKRLYDMGNEAAVVMILDGTLNRHAVHDPAYCLKGDGWSLTAETDILLPNGTARHLRLLRQGQSGEALYWYSVDGHSFTSPLRYWWTATLRRLTCGYSGQEPVLVIMVPLKGIPDTPAFVRRWHTVFSP